MYLLRQLFPAVAVAVAVAAILNALAYRAKGARASRALAACALGAGYFAGHIMITGSTPFPPADTTNWLPYFALSAAAFASLSSLLNSNFARIAVLGLVFVGAMRLLLSPKFRYEWTAEQGWLWVGGLGCATLLLALSVEAIARRSSIAMELTFMRIIVSAATAGALMLSGSLLLGQFAAVLSAAILGSLVLAWRDGIEGEGDGAAPVFAVLLVALLASGYFFAELPAPSALLLVAAPLSPLLPMGISTPRWAAVARLALVIAVVSGAVSVAYRSSPPWME